MWFHYYCQKRVSAMRWSKITPGRRWNRSQQEADLFSQRMALNGDRIECSTLMSIWLRPQLRKRFNVDPPCLEPHQCVPFIEMPNWSSNRFSAFTCMPIFSPSLFFFFQKTGAFRQTLLGSAYSRNPKSSQMKFSVCRGVVSRLLCLLKYINSTWSKWNSCCKIEIYHFCLALNVKVAL